MGFKNWDLSANNYFCEKFLNIIFMEISAKYVPLRSKKSGYKYWIRKKINLAHGPMIEALT
jgi:hypothetical protein